MLQNLTLLLMIAFQMLLKQFVVELKSMTMFSFRSCLASDKLSKHPSAPESAGPSQATTSFIEKTGEKPNDRPEPRSKSFLKYH